MASESYPVDPQKPNAKIPWASEEDSTKEPGYQLHMASSGIALEHLFLTEPLQRNFRWLSRFNALASKVVSLERRWIARSIQPDRELARCK
jgi:hypothetical protein